MALIDVNGPGTVPLGIFMLFFFAVILFLPYFHFWSVLPKLQASSGKIGEALRAMQRQLYWCYIEMLLALRCTLRLKAKQGAFAAPIGEAQRIGSPNKKFSQIFFIRCASPTGGVQIALPIVWAQHKGNKRIGKSRTSICCASPIVIEIACLFRCTDQKRNFVQCKTTAN